MRDMGNGAHGSKSGHGTRRGNHEGSIYQVAEESRWRAAYTKPDGRRGYLSAPTRESVRQKLLAAQRMLEDGLAPGGGRQTLATYLRSWLAGLAPTVAEKTWAFHRGSLERDIVPALGRVQLTALTPAHLEAFYARLLARGLSPTTVRHEHGTLRQALNRAVRLGLVARNVARLAQAPRARTPEMRPLSRDEAQVLLDVASGERLEALFVLALSTGMRQGELLGLRWRDVNLETGRLSVRCQLRRSRVEHHRDGTAEPASWQFAPLKTTSSRRQITLSKLAEVALRRHHAQQAREKLTAGPLYHDLDLVFCSMGGRPLLARNVVRRFKELLRAADLPDVRFHDLRHTAATLALGQVNPKAVSEMLGHASVAMTLGRYSHVTPPMQDQLANVMGALLGSPPLADASASTDQVS